MLQAGINALDHFIAFGWREGRDPDEFFSTNFYLGANPDARAAGVNPLSHYHTTGWKNGYDPGPNFDTGLYLSNNPDVAAAGIDPLEHFLQSGRAEGRVAYAAIGNIVGGFDAQYYLQHNPDVAAARVDPLVHFNTYGWHEGRNPNALFDTKGYLTAYGDVAAANVNPLDHYHQHGWTEGRDPSTGFDTTALSRGLCRRRRRSHRPARAFPPVRHARGPFALRGRRVGLGAPHRMPREAARSLRPSAASLALSSDGEHVAPSHAIVRLLIEAWRRRAWPIPATYSSMCWPSAHGSMSGKIATSPITFDEGSPAHLWTTFEKAIYRAALQEWANVANVTFQEVSSPAGADLFETWVTPACHDADLGTQHQWRDLGSCSIFSAGE